MAQKCQLTKKDITELRHDLVEL